MYKTNTKKLKKGDIFVAIENGHQYIDEALKKGATVVCEKGINENCLVVPNTRIYLAERLKETYYDQIKDMILIGITGTNGKTTTAYLIHQALNHLNIKCAYIGTIGFYIKTKRKNLRNTTPEIDELYELFLRAKKEKCKVVVMEVSSHSLEKRRVHGLLFDYCLFTNLTEDHLDYHGSMEEYAKAKRILFSMCKGNKIVNHDDFYSSMFIDDETLTYGFKKSDYTIRYDGKKIFHINDKVYDTNLIGKYNIYNLACVIIILNLMHLKDDVSYLLPPPGRMQKIEYHSNTIVVDYAHTPDAVKNVLEAVKNLGYHHIYTIIGCGGNRDKKKRPIMGRIASSLSDYCIFTSDNPRDEDAQAILRDIVLGVDTSNYKIIVNRENAIKYGIQMLEKNDILMVLGKGHETYQVIKNKKIHFDDVEIVNQYIRR